MSVDYNCCKHCGESKYEELVTPCNWCGEYICSKCAIGNEDEYFDEDKKDWGGYLKEEFCPICKKNEENKDKVRVWNTFNTFYFWERVEVEIKKIIK